MPIKNLREIHQIALDAYWADDDNENIEHIKDGYVEGFLEGVSYALDYAKLQPDGVTLEVEPLPGCEFPNPYK